MKNKHMVGDFVLLIIFGVGLFSLFGFFLSSGIVYLKYFFLYFVNFFVLFVYVCSYVSGTSFLYLIDFCYC